MAGAATLEFNENNFESDVIQSDQPVLVDFWAEWCMPCRALGPVMDELAVQYTGKAKVGKLNVDQSPNLSAKYQVSSIPTVIVFHKGDVMQKFVGLRNKRDYETALNGLTSA